MSLKTKAAEAALELATNENVLDKTTGLLGMLFPYSGVKQKAIEMYIEDIEKSDLPRETKISLLLNIKKDFKKIKNQKAIAEIALDNAKEGTDFSDKSGVNEDWLDRYMDSAKFVSSEDMQLIWGKILANEFEIPGSTPPNMIRVLSEISTDLANEFRKICSMTVTINPLEKDGKIENGPILIVPFSENRLVFEKIGLRFGVLGELETLGLIKYSGSGYGIDCHKGIYEICIHNNIYRIQNSENTFPVGNVMLTDAGEALQKITEPIEIDEYNHMMTNYMTSQRIEYTLNDNISQD